MSQQDLIRTIQAQSAELNQLREQIGRIQNTDFYGKYVKALKQIGEVVKANRQLKAELDKLNSFRSTDQDNMNRINQQQIGKAYQKVLKQKNELLGENESLGLQNQKLRKNIFSLEGALTQLKGQKMALAREKQALTSKLSVSDKSGSEGFSEKLKGRDSKEKQTQFKKAVQNLEQRNNSLQKTNRKLEQQINELQTKIFNIESEYKNKLMQKDVELKTSKSNVREEYQLQINTFKKQITMLKSTNNQLMMRLSSASQNQKGFQDGPNQFDDQLLDAIRDLKYQMQPMSAQIAELQDKNLYEREQMQRERASLQLKVVEYQSQIQRLKEHQKMLEGKIVKEAERSRKWQESQKTIKKLEQQNRMLGGRVIVLEAKEVALRNRSGDQLQERVLEFQTRVEMLLSDKETISNMKNIGIHQLIALKAYVMQLDAKLKQVVNQNEYAVKKYKSYKEKCTHLIRQLKQHDIAINALKGKLQGYDRLVVKLQGELERAITINDNQVKAMNIKITQSTMNSIQIYKKRYESLLQKLSLQEKYAEQQIQTLKLNYDTKILDLNLKLEELSSIRETIGLYKSKNEQLSNKLTQKQNQLLETKMTKVVITDTVPQVKNPHKDTINKLHETINLKESTILSLQNQIRKTEIQWKGKYNQLEQMTSATITKKSREDEQKQREIETLENQIRSYRNKINQLESKTIHLHNSKSDDELDYKRTNHFTGQISDLEVQLEDFRNRYETENARVAKLNKANVDLKQANNELEAEVSRLKFEVKRLQKQMQLELDDKNTEIKRLQSRTQQNYLDSSRVQKSEPENNFKINSLRMELEMVQGQLEQLEKDKARYYNRSIQLERQVSELNVRIEQLNYTLQRTKNNINNDLVLKQTEKEQQIQKLLYNLRNLKDKNAELEDRISEYQTQLTKVRNQLLKQRQKLLLENDGKQQQISRLTRELNRVKADISNHDDARSTLEQQYEYKLNRANKQNNDLRDELNRFESEIQRYEGEMRFLKNRELQYNSKAEEQENYLIKISHDLRNLQNKEVQLESEVMEKDTLISKLSSELNYIRSQIGNIQSTIENKDTYINKLNSELNALKNNQIEWQIEVSSKANEQNKLNSDLMYAKSRITDLEHQVETTKMELNRVRAQNLSNEHNYSSQVSEIQDRDMTIMRLQSEIKSKTELIHDLQFEISSKSSKLNDLQNQSIRLRSISTDMQSELLEKNGQISRLNYQLNNIRVKYDNLQQEHSSADSNWLNMNRQLANIRAQIGNYEDDLAMKDMTLERYKSDIKDLTQQIERINQQIFEKNKTINNLNQQLFKLRLEGQDKSSDRIYKLQAQIYQLKSKVTNLQNELDTKEEQLGRARMQISTVRSNITVNRYTDEQYDLLQAQFYQVQKSLTETRSLISEKDLEITQLEAKIQYMKKMEVDAKRRFVEQRNDLQTELQNVLNRQRQLRNQISNLQSEAVLAQNRTTDEQKWGLHLYQQECDRLQKIVEQLQNEVNSLKLKLTYMTNQEDRIIQNLTIMTLTFAEVQALRERMKTKQNQISQVRKSLIHFASSSEEITSMGSRMLIKQQTGRSNKSIDRNIEEIQPYNDDNVNIPIGSFKKSDKLFYTQESSYVPKQTKSLYQTQNYNNKSEIKASYEVSDRKPNNNPVSYPQYGRSDFTGGQAISNNNAFQNKNQEIIIEKNKFNGGAKPISVQSKYRTEDFEQERNEPNQEDEWNQYSAYQQNAERKLNELVNSMTAQQNQSSEANKEGKSDPQIPANKQTGQISFTTQNRQVDSDREQMSPTFNIPSSVQQGSQKSQSQKASEKGSQQSSQMLQKQQAQINSQTNIQNSEQAQISQNQQFQQVPQFAQAGQAGQIAQYPPQSLQTKGSFGSLQGQSQIPVSNPGSWRYGSSQGSQSISINSNIQHQGTMQTGQIIQTSQQRTSQVRFGSSNSNMGGVISGSIGVIPAQPSFVGTGPILIPNANIQPQSVQFQGIQGRQQFGVLQQPLQYPGFAR